MKKLLILIIALCATSTLSAQTYKVGDYYNVGDKRGVVFEVSEDGKHGTVIADSGPVELMTLLEVHEVVNEKLQEVGQKLTMHPSFFYWSTTEFNADCVWVVCMKTGSTGGSYKGNPFNVRAVSKF